MDQLMKLYMLKMENIKKNFLMDYIVKEMKFYLFLIIILNFQKKNFGQK